MNLRLSNRGVWTAPTYVYGSYPDIDGLFREQATELDRKRREATLHRIQQLVHEKAMFAPIWQLAAPLPPLPSFSCVASS